MSIQRYQSEVHQGYTPKELQQRITDCQSLINQELAVLSGYLDAYNKHRNVLGSTLTVETITNSANPVEVKLALTYTATEQVTVQYAVHKNSALPDIS